MAFNNIPPLFKEFSEQGTKNLVIAIEIEGIDDIISTAPLSSRANWGSPGLSWGDPGVVWGGLRPFFSATGGENKTLISLDGSSLTLQQRIEPEQGRSSVSMLTLAFIDKDEYMTRLITPGVILDEILGKSVKIYIGYEQIAFPDDYLIIFRGRISSVDSGAGLVTMQFSDPNSVRKQNVFYTAMSSLIGSITNVATTIPIASTTDFHQRILGPNGTYDSAIKTFIQIEDEIIETTAATFSPTSISGVTRGVRGTTAAPHAVTAAVSSAVGIIDQALKMALKIMLSGWNGPSATDLAILNLAITNDPDLVVQSSAIVLPFGVDAERDMGLAIGDYLTITGDPTPSNNQTVTIDGFDDVNGQTNNLIYTSGTFTPSTMTPAVFSVRSQFDTYPPTCGQRMTGMDVDVERFVFFNNQFLAQEVLNFFLFAEERGKDFIDAELMLATSSYTLTRNGRISCNITLPPLADDRLIFLTKNNVISPQTIRPIRAVNNRKFFNEIDWEYDPDDQGNFRVAVKTVDIDSISLIGIVSALPISSRGTRPALAATQLPTRTIKLLGRYKRGAIQIPIKTMFGIGVQIEAGDIVAVEDNGGLQIPNLATGERQLGTKLFEVIDRTVELKTGNSSLLLLDASNFSIGDRFGTWSGSSNILVGSTSTKLFLTPSYGAISVRAEADKWRQYVGLNIKVRNYSWSQLGTSVLVEFDPVNLIATLSPALSFTPSAGDIMELGDYPNNTDPEDQKLVKLIHEYWTKQVAVATGISQTQFTVAPGDVQYFEIGYPVIVHTPNWSSFPDFNADGIPDDVLISDVTGTTITVDTPLGFTPSGSYVCDLLKMPDGGAPYRWV